eukprot:11471-Amphidinium_carterae.1
MDNALAALNKYMPCVHCVNAWCALQRLGRAKGKKVGLPQQDRWPSTLKQMARPASTVASNVPQICSTSSPVEVSIGGL